MCLKLEKGLDLICLVAVVAQFLQLLLLLLLLFLVVPLYTHPLLLYLKLKSTQVNSNHLTVRHFLSWRSMTKTFCDLPAAPCPLPPARSSISSIDSYHAAISAISPALLGYFRQRPLFGNLSESVWATRLMPLKSDCRKY